MPFSRNRVQSVALLLASRSGSPGSPGVTHVRSALLPCPRAAAREERAPHSSSSGLRSTGVALLVMTPVLSGDVGTLTPVAAAAARLCSHSVRRSRPMQKAGSERFREVSTGDPKREPSGSVIFSLVRGGTPPPEKYLNAGLADWMASRNTWTPKHTQDDVTGTTMTRLVLGRVLENVAAVPQVLLVEAEGEGVDLLQGRVPELRPLQVDQEVGVDRAALDEVHAHSDQPSTRRERSCVKTNASDSLDVEVLQEDRQALARSLDRKFTGAVHLVEGQTCERSRKTAYSGQYVHAARKRARLTLKPSGAAGDQDAASAPSLHAGQESLDGLDGPEEVDLQDPPHGVQGLHLQRAGQTHSGVAHCEDDTRGREAVKRKKTQKKSQSLRRQSVPRMSTRFSATLSLASRMDCRTVTSIWRMSKAKRTARLRPMPEEQPVISTTFLSMEPPSVRFRREQLEISPADESRPRRYFLPFRCVPPLEMASAWLLSQSLWDR
ncbi:hypothetical protein EYF80_049033 [Liparis tanakae]|uniref:Uncharacterized protein n=1 Tax=Liparis tanakae TaxID=230148 RepID=A0A4Z2FJ42_9TELE|nr:hypothetical protein EYF80_049033 [Liparis tanakae]